MKLFSKSHAGVGILAILLITSCGKGEPSGPADKTEAYAVQTTDNILASPKFGVSVRPPEGWQALGFDQLNELMDTGRDVLSGDNENLSEILDAGDKNTYNLFAVSQYEMGSPVEENPSVMAVAENIAIAPGVKTGRDYFFHARNLMQQSGLTYEFDDGYETREIDGVSFDRMNLAISMGGTRVKQSYYAAKRDDFIIAFIQSYTSDEGQRATDKVINSIELDW